MSDIVERLRDLDDSLRRAQQHNWLYDSDGSPVIGFHCGRIANDAADEIERLMKREEHFAKVLGVADGGQYRNDWDAKLSGLIAENERLREALYDAAESRRLLESDLQG